MQDTLGKKELERHMPPTNPYHVILHLSLESLLIIPHSRAEHRSAVMFVALPKKEGGLTAKQGFEKPRSHKLHD